MVRVEPLRLNSNLTPDSVLFVLFGSETLLQEENISLVLDLLCGGKAKGRLKLQPGL